MFLLYTRMIPKQLQRPEFRFCLIKPKDKAPFEKDWQNTCNYKFDDAKLIEHISLGGNYGIIGGFGNLLVIDFDSEEVQKEKMPLLPETFTVKTGSGRFHLYYLVDTPESMKRIKTDIQGRGKQVVAPGSIHPNGNKYEVFKDCFISTIPYSKVKEVFEVEETPSTTIQNQGDTSRSATEYRHICKLIKKGKNKEEIFSEMMAFSKWTAGTNAYREYTYNKAKKWVEERKTQNNTRNGIVNNIDDDSLDISNAIYNAAYNFRENNPFFYGKNNVFWLWNGLSYEIVDEIDLMNLISKANNKMGMALDSKIESQYIRAFRRIGRLNIPEDPPKNWIQFNDTVVDINTKEKIKPSPKYFFVNVVPWDLGESKETPILDKLLAEWVTEEYVLTTKQLLAYFCYRDNPLHQIYCLVGSRRNGKGQFSKLATKLVGSKNVVTTNLRRLSSNTFSTSALWKKNLALITETSNYINEADSLKAISGNDLITFEGKYEKEFTDNCYASLLFSTNDPPEIKDNVLKSRLYVLTFPNTFKEGKDVYERVPDQEFRNFCSQIIDILPELLKNGQLDKFKSLETREEEYERLSNPIKLFLNDCCVQDDINAFVKLSSLHVAYTKWLIGNGKRTISSKHFSTILANVGLEVERTTLKINNIFESSNWVFGVKLKDNWADFIKKDKKNVTYVENVVTLESFSTRRKNFSELLHNLHNVHNALPEAKDNEKEVLMKKNEKLTIPEETIQFSENDILEPISQIIYFPCDLCGIIPSNYWANGESGAKRALCEACHKKAQDNSKTTEK